MEHSIEEYLARQTTEELEVLLDSYLNDKSELYQYYVELEDIIDSTGKSILDAKGNKDGVVTEFNKIYTLFVEEKEIEINGTKFEIRDLTFPFKSLLITRSTPSTLLLIISKLTVLKNVPLSAAPPVIQA